MTASGDPSDAELVSRALAGDRDGFAAIYARYHGVVYRFARMMSGSHTLAEDVTQETFVVLMRDLRRYDAERAALGTYLYGVARNVTRARLRRERRFVDLGGGASAESAAPDPSSMLDALEERESIRRAIRDLPSRYREVVILCAIHGLSYADAAAALGTPVGTVRSRLSRGKQALANRLMLMRETGRIAGRVSRCLV